MFSQQPPTTCASTHAAALAATMAPGFQESIAINNLVKPTSVHFGPDGKVFVTEKSGRILVYDSLTATTPTVFADLSLEVDNYWDRGLMSLALDPNFPTSPYIYALYAYDAPIGGQAPVWNDNCPTPPGATTDGCVVSGRVVRLTADTTTYTMVPGSEQVLINGWCQQFPSHSNDTLAFGPDGALYVTSGEGANFNAVDYGQWGNTNPSDSANPCDDPPGGIGVSMTPPTAEGGALRAQSLLRNPGEKAVLNGTLLRIDPATADGMANNPNANSSDINARRIDAYGLRNPFRFTFRPGTDEVWIGDVGWGAWEEIDRVTDPTASSQNFGWPCYEGNSAQPSYQSLGLNICSSLYASPSLVTAPYYTYNHVKAVVAGDNCPTANGSSISGLAFYQGNAYPAAYHGALFFSDYSRNCIWAMQLGTNGLPDPNNIHVIESNAGSPVDLESGPGDDLFYADFNDGQIREIEPVGPNAVAVATTPASGPSPLTVQFDGTQSTDPDPSATLTYAWDLNGDGNFNDSTDAAPSATYTADGQYSVRLKITDSRGLSNVSNPLAITVGPLPVPTIDSPSSSLSWRVGDTINFSGSAVDGHGNPLPASALSWTILLHHCIGNTSDCHIHFLQTFDGIASGSFSAPDHEYPSYLELQLTATDPTNGLTATTNVRLDPQTVTLTLQSTPPGASLSIDGFTGPTPFTSDVIAGSNNSVSAPSQQTIGGRTYLYTSWSDGGAQSHSILVGNTPATYSANYTRRVPTELSKVTLPDASLVAPALWTAGRQPPSGAPLAVLAWAGSDSARHLNFERSTDGMTFTNKVVLSDTSYTTPAVLVVNSNIVVLAWVGNDSGHHINVMYDAYGKRTKLRLPEASWRAPSLTYFKGQIWLAWTGTDSGHSLNVMPMGAHGLTPGRRVTLSLYNSRSAPGLTTDATGSQLLMTWTALASPGKIMFARSSNGVNWARPGGQPSQTSLAQPNMLALNPTPVDGHTYYWAWTSTNSLRSISLVFGETISSWSAVVLLPESANGAPVMGYPGPNGTLLLVWTGNDTGRHLNIATVGT
jgi:glucose/arabinose dehydrogenase